MNESPAPVALFLSPHLDDAAFSCAEAILTLGQAGWDVIVATVFTASVDSPSGFALACQLDKGLAADIDYMALRRAEDRECMTRLGARWLHLDLREAPHRGYASALELFGPVRNDDPAREQVAVSLRSLWDACQPELCFVPLAIGAHVDHRVLVDSLTELQIHPDESLADRPVASSAEKDARVRRKPELLHYADQPYALKHPAARAAAIADLGDVCCLQFSTDRERRRKAIAAIDAYTTQVPFQFGSGSAMRVTLESAMASGTPFWQQDEPSGELNVFLRQTTTL